MPNPRPAAFVAIPLALVAAARCSMSCATRHRRAAIVGVVRATEVRVEPEVNGQLLSIAVEKGASCSAGDVVARLSAVELTAQADQARAALASAIAKPQQRLCRRAPRAGRLAESRHRQGQRPPRLRAGPAHPDQHAGAPELRIPAVARPGRERRRKRACRRGRGPGQLRCRRGGTDPGRARHRRRAGAGRGRRGRGARAPARQDGAARAGRRRGQRHRRRGRRERSRGPADPDGRGRRPAMALVQRARGPSRSSCDREKRRTWCGTAPAARPRRSSPSCGRSASSPPGRPSAWSAITTATRCGCASIPPAPAAISNPA